jgi:C_GCAxxG_C_C family probable redox protein
VDDLFFKLMKLKAKGYCCAQILIILALEALGTTNEDLVRAVNGLCFGITGSDEVCGAFSGGACLISLYAGKGNDSQSPHDDYILMIGELVEWFEKSAEKEFGGTRCIDILTKFPDRSICGRIVTATFEKCSEILADHGFDMTSSCS